MHDASGLPVKQIRTAFPAGESGFFIHRSVVQMESMAVSKTSDFGSSPNGPAMAL